MVPKESLTHFRSTVLPPDELAKFCTGYAKAFAGFGNFSNFQDDKNSALVNMMTYAFNGITSLQIEIIPE